MTPARVELGERDEDEGPLVQAGVGHLDLVVGRDQIAVGQDVHVDHPRAPAPGGHPADLALDALDQAQQGVQGEPGLPPDDLI